MNFYRGAGLFQMNNLVCKTTLLKHTLGFCFKQLKGSLSDLNTDLHAACIFNTGSCMIGRPANQIGNMYNIGLFKTNDVVS